MLCFPLDLIRTRILAEPSASAGFVLILRGVLRNEGFRALYGGCLPALMSVAPSGAVFYGVYDMLKVPANPKPFDYNYKIPHDTFNRGQHADACYTAIILHVVVHHGNSCMIHPASHPERLRGSTVCMLCICCD